LINQSGKFQKCKFKLLASISSNTWPLKIEHITITVKNTVAVHLNPVATLLDGATVDASPLCPDPSHRRRRRRGDSTPGPPSLLPSNLHVADHPALASTDPQHSTAETEAPQHASEAAVPMVARRTRQGPRADELLAALALDAPAYKRPRRSNEEKHPVPSYLPDTLVSPRSL
jgi:hypothetical protein